ncbi:uncharacterized protein [Chiloscyllium punctatum]|uniref:uncharacterized protein isoform X2 n=1 Tax=Chiloscyllium punctatum TaxID=137246 RepID=UPI003B637025
MVPVAEVIRTAGKAEQVRQLVPREIIWGPGDPPSEQDQVSETSRGGRQARAPRPGSCPRGEETVRQEFSCRPVPAPCHIFDITTQKWPYQFQCETPSSGQLLILGRREGGGNLFTCSNWSESKEGIYSANSGGKGGQSFSKNPAELRTYDTLLCGNREINRGQRNQDLKSELTPDSPVISALINSANHLPLPSFPLNFSVRSLRS